MDETDVSKEREKLEVAGGAFKVRMALAWLA